MKKWKTLERRTILDERPWLRVEAHKVQLPDGRVIPNWQWIISPDYVNVLAVTRTGKFLCFRQGKYGVKGTSLAPIGGYVDSGEKPLATAKRELLEETGYEAAKWVDLGHYCVDPNRGVATGHLFLALDARRVCEPVADDLEEQELLLLSRAQLEKALDAGEFKVLAWAATIAFALRHLDAVSTRLAKRRPHQAKSK
jgi:ADP-ribose pyrophosphatase